MTTPRRQVQAGSTVQYRTFLDAIGTARERVRTAAPSWLVDWDSVDISPTGNLCDIVNESDLTVVDRFEQLEHNVTDEFRHRHVVEMTFTDGLPAEYVIERKVR